MKIEALEPSKILLDGQYIITDPCYLIREEDWSKVCRLFFEENRVFSVDGKIVPMFSTAYGDGSYEVILNHKVVGTFGVDAGMFCFMPWKDGDKFPYDDNCRTIVTLKGELTYSKGDAFLDGELIVDTSGEYSRAGEDSEDW